MTETSKLLPCPFCGRQPRSDWNGVTAGYPDDGGYWAIECCSVHVHEDDESDAVRVWNTRAPSTVGVEAPKIEIVKILRSRVHAHSDAEDIAPSVTNAEEVADLILRALSTPARPDGEAVAWRWYRDGVIVPITEEHARHVFDRWQVLSDDRGGAMLMIKQLWAEIDRLRAFPPPASAPFQFRVKPWMDACFGSEISADKVERNHRFLEEALELVQACGCEATEAHQLVDYVYGRDQGDINQEVGGVIVTLAALCLANGFDMHTAAETELKRIWGKIETIRAKQAAKPKNLHLPASPASTGVRAALVQVRQELWVDYCLHQGRTDTDPAPFNSKPVIRIIDRALAPSGLTDTDKRDNIQDRRTP